MKKAHSSPKPPEQPPQEEKKRNLIHPAASSDQRGRQILPSSHAPWSAYPSRERERSDAGATYPPRSHHSSPSTENKRFSNSFNPETDTAFFEMIRRWLALIKLIQIDFSGTRARSSSSLAENAAKIKDAIKILKTKVKVPRQRRALEQSASSSRKRKNENETPLSFALTHIFTKLIKYYKKRSGDGLLDTNNRLCLILNYGILEIQNPESSIILYFLSRGVLNRVIDPFFIAPATINYLLSIQDTSELRSIGSCIKALGALKTRNWPGIHGIKPAHVVRLLEAALSLNQQPNPNKVAFDQLRAGLDQLATHPPWKGLLQIDEKLLQSISERFLPFDDIVLENTLTHLSLIPLTPDENLSFLIDEKVATIFQNKFYKRDTSRRTIGYLAFHILFQLVKRLQNDTAKLSSEWLGGVKRICIILREKQNDFSFNEYATTLHNLSHLAKAGDFHNFLGASILNKLRRKAGTESLQDIGTCLMAIHHLNKQYGNIWSLESQLVDTILARCEAEVTAADNLAYIVWAVSLLYQPGLILGNSLNWQIFERLLLKVLHLVSDGVRGNEGHPSAFQSSSEVADSKKDTAKTDPNFTKVTALLDILYSIGFLGNSTTRRSSVLLSKGIIYRVIAQLVKAITVLNEADIHSLSKKIKRGIMGILWLAQSFNLDLREINTDIWEKLLKVLPGNLIVIWFDCSSELARNGVLSGHFSSEPLQAYQRNFYCQLPQKIGPAPLVLSEDEIRSLAQMYVSLATLVRLDFLRAEEVIPYTSQLFAYIQNTELFKQITTNDAGVSVNDTPIHVFTHNLDWGFILLNPLPKNGFVSCFGTDWIQSLSKPPLTKIEQLYFSVLVHALQHLKSSGKVIILETRIIRFIPNEHLVIELTLPRIKVSLELVETPYYFGITPDMGLVITVVGAENQKNTTLIFVDGEIHLFKDKLSFRDVMQRKVLRDRGINAHAFDHTHLTEQLKDHIYADVEDVVIPALYNSLSALLFPDKKNDKHDTAKLAPEGIEGFAAKRQWEDGEGEDAEIKEDLPSVKRVKGNGGYGSLWGSSTKPPKSPPSQRSNNEESTYVKGIN